MKTTTILMIALGLVASAYGELTGEARILKEKRDAKIAEINRIYLAELGKIKAKEMQAGNREAAEAIEAEIYGDEPGDSKTIPTDEKGVLRLLIGKWRRTGAGTRIDGDTIQFIDEKSGTFKGETAFRTRYNARTGIISITSDHWTDELTLTGNPDVLDGKTGAGLTYQFVRIK